jgi:hypothetical protein
MPVVSSYLNKNLKEFIGAYTRLRNRPIFRWIIDLFFSKKLQLTLEHLSSSSEAVYPYSEVKACLEGLGKMSNLTVWLLGFLFKFMHSRLFYVYRFLDVMHQNSKLEQDFVAYPMLEEFVKQFNYFWLANHWSDIQHKLKNHTHAFSVLHALISLDKNNMLYDWSIAKILPVLLAHHSPLKLVKPLKQLADADMLAGHEGFANLIGLEQSFSPEDWVNALIQLKQVGLLNQNVRALLLTSTSPMNFSKFLVCLFFSGRLHPAHQKDLLAEIMPHMAVFTSPTISRFWELIPPTGITVTIYHHMLEICRTPNIDERGKAERLSGFLTTMFFPNQIDFQRVEDRNSINPSQSIHTASVNQSVKDSIIKLKKLYEPQMPNRQAVFLHYQNLRQLVLGKCQTLQQDALNKIKSLAAIRAVKRIDSGELNYQEKNTQTDIILLLALIDCAVHDKQRMRTNVDDFLILLINSLYELQRGDNLSQKAQDNALADKSICLAGSFTKIFESICALHQDCHVIYVTAQSITNKMICVVNQSFKDYLNQLPYEKAQDLLSDAKLNGLNEAVWQTLKPQVESAMHTEFDDVLPMSSVSKTNFDAILKTAGEVPLSLENYQIPKRLSHGNQFFKSAGSKVEEAQCKPVL